MPETHGSKSVFTFAGVELTGFLTNIGFPRERDTSDTSAMGDTDKSHVVGLRGGSISLSGWYDPTDTTGPDDTLNDAFEAGDSEAFEYGPTGDTALMKKYSGNATVTNYEVTSSVEDTVAFTATLLINGAVTRGAYA